MLEEWLKNPGAVTVTGVLFALIGLLVKGILVPGFMVDRWLADKDKQIAKLEAENTRLDDRIYRLLAIGEKATDLAAERRS